MYPPADSDATLDVIDPLDGFDNNGSLIVPEVDGEILPEGEETALATTPSEEELALQQEQAERDEEEFQEKLKGACKDLVNEYEIRDQPVREFLIRNWRKHELFWEGIQNLIFDGMTLQPASQTLVNMGETADEFDPYYYDKIVNIYRAYGESVIAALTQEVPPVVFPPVDAANVNDVRTSEAYNRISELIDKHNQAPLILLHAMFILWNQGLVAGYTYTHTDKKYGTYNVPIEGESIPRQVISGFYCPFCGQDFFESPDMDGNGMCDACDRIVHMEPEFDTIRVPKIVGYDTAPKSRECIKAFGPLEVFIPHYVREQEQVPIAVLKTDIHYTLAREKFPNIADKIGPATDEEPYGRWARSYPEGYGDDDVDLTTVRQCWLRPWVFNKYQKIDPEFFKQVRERFPKGVEFHIVNNTVDEVIDEDMDECWTFSVNPLSSHLHAKPLGAPLVPIQEIRNELVLLKLQSVEYGIPETFVDSTAINWAAYKQNPARPGVLYPAKSKPGQTLDGSFTTLKTATFPPESIEFQQELDEDAQFVVGAFPSIYGGALSGGGKTASEYNMSRNQALQRLSVIWKFVSWWWANVKAKSVRHFHLNLVKTGEDQQYSVKTGKAWTSVWIRREELMGSVGEVEPELADTFPMSWAQRRDLLMQLLLMKDDTINSVIFNQENSGLVSQYLGFPNLYIPGQDDRSKQLQEIYLLTMEGAEPIEMPNGMEFPSVPVDPEIDKHAIEYETCTVWMKSDQGLDCKLNNPAGYANVRAHAQWHLMLMMQQQQAQAEAESGNEEKKENPAKESEGEQSGGE